MAAPDCSGSRAWGGVGDGDGREALWRWRIRDGKLAENRVQMDMIGLMQQIGAMPRA
jgi:hypothetical protein